jgi:hypothetical protein
MSAKEESIPPQARKAIRLAIATHLLAPSAVLQLTRQEMEPAVDHAYFLADLLMVKSGLT